MAPARCRRARLQTPPDLRQRCAPTHTTAPATPSVGELDLQHSSPNDLHAGGQGSALSWFGRDRQLDLPGSPVPARSFQVLCQPNPAPDLIGKRLAALHALERRDQILAPNQKRAAGLVAAKLVQQADGGAPAHFAAVFLSWRDRRRGQGTTGAGRGRWQAGETTGASEAFWVKAIRSCSGTVVPDGMKFNL